MKIDQRLVTICGETFKRLWDLFADILRIWAEKNGTLEVFVDYECQSWAEFSAETKSSLS